MVFQHPTSDATGYCENQPHDDIGAQLVHDEASNFFDFDAWAQMDQLIDPPGSGVTPELDAGTAQRSFEPLEVHAFGLDSFNGVQSFEVDNCNGLGGTQTVDVTDSDTLAWNHSHVPPCGNDMEQDWPGVTNPDDEAPVDNSADHRDVPIPDIPVYTTLALATGIEMETVAPAEVHELVANGINVDLLETPTLPLSKRTRISKQAKDVLQTHFRTNPYPNKEETLSLSKATKLTLRTIKTWFTNTRSRIKTINGHCKEPIKVSMPTETSQQPKQDERFTRGVSRASLEALEKISPAGSTHSLQRWLNTPVNEDAVLSRELSPPRMPPSSSQYCLLDLMGPIDNNSLRKSHLSLNISESDLDNLSRSRKASSVASSLSSRASDSSSVSQRSFKSIDSRGPRRGRKVWQRSQSMIPGRQQPVSGLAGDNARYSDLPSATKIETKMRSNIEEVTLPYFCTIQKCKAKFRHPFEWRRHEEALHYQPYHWVCCLDTHICQSETLPQCWVCGELNVTEKHYATQHFYSCAEKQYQDRMFLREDQLLQHINGVHLTTRVSKKVAQVLLSRWKIDNPDFDRNILICGFCGEVSDTWQQRHEHVTEHLRVGACKTAWWPKGPSLVNYESVNIDTEGPFNCPHCGIWLQNLQVASKEHSQCITWSCRNLQDPHAVFINRMGLCWDWCRLCGYREFYSSTDSQRPKEQQEHEFLHKIRDCNQEIFSNVGGFIRHLESRHGAEEFLLYQPDPWKLQRTLIWQPGAVYTLRSQRFVDPESVCDENDDRPVCDH